MIAMLVMVSALSTLLVTGNGFGYAVVDAGAVTRLYAHPYRFMRMKDDSVDGVPTSNLIRRAEWTGDESAAAVSYVSESHVIRAQKRTLTAEFFEPFALQRNVLMTTSKAGCFAITWDHPVKSARKLGAGATLYSF